MMRPRWKAALIIRASICGALTRSPQRECDIRESPSLDLIPSLIENVKEIKVYDPVAMEDYQVQKFQKH